MPTRTAPASSSALARRALLGAALAGCLAAAAPGAALA